MKTREDLDKYFGELGFTKGAEVGVMSGSHSAELCKHNPNLYLYCIDMWDLNPSRYDGFRERKYQQAVQIMAPYNCELIKDFSMDAVKRFADDSLDFVYIDANHSFDHIMRDILEWSMKVKRGGIVSGHDYGEAVKDAVDTYVKWHNRKLNVTTEKTKGGYSWWFVR